VEKMLTQYINGLLDVKSSVPKRALFFFVIACVARFDLKIPSKLPSPKIRWRPPPYNIAAGLMKTSCGSVLDYLTTVYQLHSLGSISKRGDDYEMGRTWKD
jgi:hypothetical protein